MVCVTLALVNVNEKISPMRANHNRVTLKKVKVATVCFDTDCLTHGKRPCYSFTLPNIIP